MPPKNGRPQSQQRAKSSDWLKVNGLTRGIVLRQLVMIKEPNRASITKTSPPLGMSAEAAWALCARSMHSAFPGLAGEIASTEAKTPKCLEPKAVKHPKSFTYDLGFNNPPFVSVHYQDRASDLLVMAHEFGHAVQITAGWGNGKGQMPPLARECCAFLAELALVQQCTGRFPALMSTHLADDTVYFGENKVALKDAMWDPRRPYQYDWNYPLARLIAAHLFKNCGADQACAIYRAGTGGGQRLNRFAETLDMGGLAA